MVRAFTILTISALMLFSNAFAIEAGPQVPTTPSTQSSYCPNGVCGTTSLPQPPANYIKSTIQKHVIVILLSETCQRMNENGISGCPHISNLTGFDNSNQAISGKFVKHGNDYTRTKPQLTNHYIWYKDYALPVVCVDCYTDLGNTNNVLQIIIEPHDFVWIDKYNDVSLNTRTFTQFHGRYMAGCDSATLAYDWNLMTDTIYYMRHGCVPSATDYDNTSTYTLPSTAFDMNAQPLKTQGFYKSAKSCTALNSCTDINTGKKW